MNQAAMEMPLPTSDIEIGKQNLDTYGFTVHKNYVSKDAANAIRKRLEEQATQEREQGLASFHWDESENDTSPIFLAPHTGRPVGLPKHQLITLLANKGREFIELATNPAILAYAEHVFEGIPFNIMSETGLVVRKGCPPQPIHIDEILHFPADTTYPALVNVMICLGIFNEENGATRVIPKSHKWDKTKISDYAGPSIPLIMEPGDAAIWNARLWHGQGEAFSDEPRYSISMAYGVHYIKQFDCYPSSIHDDVYRTMNDQELTVYGFRAVTSGRISPRSSDDKRRNVNFQYLFVPELRGSERSES